MKEKNEKKNNKNLKEDIKHEKVEKEESKDIDQGTNGEKERDEKEVSVGKKLEEPKVLGEEKEEVQKYLNSIYQNCSTALQSIHDILPKIEDEKLKSEIKGEYHGYQIIFRKCEDFAKKQDIMIKDNNWFKKARLYSSINMGTLTNRTTRKITEMLLLGTVMGLNECYKNKWDYHDLNKELDEILEELCDFQDNCYKSLKGFLKKNI